MERRCLSNLKHNWWNTVNTVVLPCHLPVSGLGQEEREEPCCKIFLSRVFMQYAVNFVYHSQTFHLKMGVGHCKSWGKRAKYENKSYWKSSDLLLWASPCASSPAFAWDSGRGGLLEFLSTLCSLYSRSENSNYRMRGNVCVLPWNSTSQSQNAAAVPRGFGRSTQGFFFFFPKTYISTAGDTQVLVGLGTRLRRKELICGQGGELRCTAAEMWVWTICYLQWFIFSSYYILWPNWAACLMACPVNYHCDWTATWQKMWVAPSLLICLRSQEHRFCVDTCCNNSGDAGKKAVSPPFWVTSSRNFLSKSWDGQARDQTKA